MKSSEHRFVGAPALSRRTFIKAGTASTLAVTAKPSLLAGADPAQDILAEPVAKLQYLTEPDQFHTFVREKPPIDKFSAEKCRAVGLDQESWQLELVADPKGECKLEKPFSKELGRALTFPALLKLGEQHAVRFLHLLSCTNVGQPLGMGLWEGVPLRQVIWLARPGANARRVCYWGYHNDDDSQRFVSSLAIGRVLEDPPGELPVILCYKLNGQWLPLKNGGPVRLIVPGAYGNKSVKWLQRIEVTTSYQANDTYAQWKNDVESPMKTQARFLTVPKKVKSGQPIPLVGLAQVGMSGLSQVQVALEHADAPASTEDPYCTRLNWQEAEILPPPRHWGGGLPDGKLPAILLQFDPATGRPREWPLRYTWVHWTAQIQGPSPGQYLLRCRTIDINGVAQPMPRPFPRSGSNALQEVPLLVEG